MSSSHKQAHLVAKVNIGSFSPQSYLNTNKAYFARCFLDCRIDMLVLFIEFGMLDSILVAKRQQLQEIRGSGSKFDHSSLIVNQA